MARPERLDDIEINEVDMGKIDVRAIATDGTLLKAWGTFLEAVQKAGNVRLEDNHYGVQMYRQPTVAEQLKQLTEAQNRWDADQALYEEWASGATMSAEYKVDAAKRHARENDLPMFPWEREGKVDADLDATLAKIDGELADA